MGGWQPALRVGMARLTQGVRALVKLNDDYHPNSGAYEALRGCACSRRGGFARRRGEIYGFLGLNGAGKTTTIRALLGMIRPSAGTVSLFGGPVGPNGRGPWRRVGHLVERPAAYPELSVRENLEIARRLYGVADPQRRLAPSSVSAWQPMRIAALACSLPATSSV